MVYICSITGKQLHDLHKVSLYTLLFFAQPTYSRISLIGSQRYNFLILTISSSNNRDIDINVYSLQNYQFYYDALIS